jgi:transposase-like protein
MDFPIVELMDREACVAWLTKHFHPDGLKCPHCQAGVEQAIRFRKTKSSELKVYRCKVCRGIYNLYSGTEFEGRRFTPEQTLLFLREVLQGKSTAKLSRELHISRTTGLALRHLLQANAQKEQTTEPLSDLEVETDEMFQNAGEKRRLARRPSGSTSKTRQ